MNTKRITALACLIFVTLLAVHATPSSSSALAEPGITFTVNASSDVTDAVPGDGVCETVTDNGMCTLRAAIMEANALIGNDTIILPAATYALTIPGVDEDASATGDLDVTENLTIIGDQAGETVINAEELGDRVIELHQSAARVNMSYVQIARGTTIAGGGGIASYTALSLSNSTLGLNSAGTIGGAIFNGSNLILSNVIFQLNHAQTGGGIFNAGNLTINTVTFYQNSSSESGAAIYIPPGTTADIKNAEFTLNIAMVNGAGINNTGGFIRVEDSTFDQNIAKGDGAGIYNEINGKISLSRVQITNNEADNSGGGIYNDPTGQITLADVTVNQNSSVNAGGGIYNKGIIEGQTVGMDHNNSAVGGAIDNVQGELHFQRAYFSNNSANHGGAIYDTGNLILSDSSIFSNTSVYNGGGIYSYGGVLQLNNISISANHGQFGGGIHCATGQYHWTWCDLTIINSTIDNNLADTDGGGIFNYSDIYIINSTISGNEAVNNGGGIYNSDNFNSFNNTIADNLASSTGPTGQGGGIYSEYGNFSMQNTILFGNQRMEAAPVGDDCYGTLITNHYNLVGTLTSCTLSNDQGLDLVGQDPQLGSLAYNGGLTPTHALLEGSPAIDAANPAGCYDQQSYSLTNDQRGYLRHWDGNGDGVARCDIGSFEYHSVIRFFLPITWR